MNLTPVHHELLIELRSRSVRYRLTPTADRLADLINYYRWLECEFPDLLAHEIVRVHGNHPLKWPAFLVIVDPAAWSVAAGLLPAGQAEVRVPELIAEIEEAVVCRRGGCCETIPDDVTDAPSLARYLGRRLVGGR